MISPMEKAQLNDHERRLRIIEATLRPSDPPAEPSASVPGVLTAEGQKTEAEREAEAQGGDELESEQTPAEDEDGLEELEDVDE